MNRRKKVASVAFTGVAAVGAVGFTAGQARAASVSKVTVTPGGHYNAVAVGSPTLGDTTTNNTLTCTIGTASGSLTGSPAGAKVGSVANATFSNCSVLTLPFTAHLNHPATLVATSPTTASGVTKGVLQSISATISGTGGFACKAVVTGSLPGSYNNSGLLTIDPSHSPTLHVKSAANCAGAIKSSDNAYFSATYAVSPVQTVNAT